MIVQRTKQLFSTRNLRRFLPRFLLGMLMTIAMLGYSDGAIKIPLMDRLETFAHDVRIRVTAPHSPHPKIVIVDLDEKSLSAEGRWPWRRDKVARLFDLLIDHYKAAVVGVDVVFAEPDDSSGLELLNTLEQQGLGSEPKFIQLRDQLKPGLDRDDILVRALEERRIILGYYFNIAGDENSAHSSGELPDEVFDIETFTGRQVNFLEADGYGGNLPDLQFAAWGGGHFNPHYDIDGVTRRIPTLIRFGSKLYESLSVAVVRSYLGDQPIRPRFFTKGNHSTLEAFYIKDKRIPLDRNASLLVPFRGPQGSFAYLSATDVLNQRVEQSDIANKIVLIGASAPGLLDLRVTPIDTTFPGVELHANAIAGILDGNLKHLPPDVADFDFYTVLATGLFLSMTLPFIGALKAAFLASGTAGAIITGNLYFWIMEHNVLPLSTPLVLIALIFVIDMFYGYFFEARAKKQVADLFGQYVPPDVVSQLQDNPEQVSMEGESREMTVLFSDVRSFTEISERLSAKELKSLMNAYMGYMTEAIHRHNGTIDKYVGDMVMAFWGAPLHDPDHPRKALLGAMEMQRMGIDLRKEFKAKGWPELRFGIGLNTGEMNVGNMGSEFRRAYTVLGDAVNLGSRLESISKKYSAEIIVSESTQKENPDITFMELDRIRVKGKKEPVTIFEPMGFTSELTDKQEELLELWNEMLTFYRHQAWGQAGQQLQHLQTPLSGRPALIRLYQERIAQFRAAPPPGEWDGVFTYETK